MSLHLKKILIVEDSDLLHRMYELIFRRYRMEGCELLHAYNGREGLDLLAKHPDVDIVLLDINMPIMSGLELLTRIKREEAFRDLTVIIISTEGKEEDTLRGLEAGARGYLTKPFQPADLHRLIERVFETRESRVTTVRTGLARP
jgi:two-component system chemotaxis response regulator CheY